MPGIERFSNRYTLARIVQGGFFLRKKPLCRIGFGVPQLENRVSPQQRYIQVNKLLLIAILPV